MRIVDWRTTKKDIQMSGDLAMTKEEWLQRGGECRGSLGAANKAGCFSVRQCENMKQPVGLEELDAARDFAMIKMNGGYYFLRDGRQKCPCIPVFYRNRRPLA